MNKAQSIRLSASLGAAFARMKAAEQDAARYRAFFDAGLPITFCGVEYDDKPSLDAAIDAAAKDAGKREAP
jgi:hypothetical protein